MVNKEIICEAIRTAGYEYTKSYYESWKEIFSEELNDEDSYYYESLDENGFPAEDKLSEQVSENAYHNYCNGTTADFFEEFEIGKFSEEEIASVDNDYLYDYFQEGISKFISEKYK